MFKEKNCAYCKRTYAPSTYNQRFCSNSCKNCFSSSKRLKEKEERKNISKSDSSTSVNSKPFDWTETPREKGMYRIFDEILRADPDLAYLYEEPCKEDLKLECLNKETLENLINWGEMLVKIYEAKIDKNLQLEAIDFKLLHELKIENKKR